MAHQDNNEGTYEIFLARAYMKIFFKLKIKTKKMV